MSNNDFLNMKVTFYACRAERSLPIIRITMNHVNVCITESDGVEADVYNVYLQARLPSVILLDHTPGLPPGEIQSIRLTELMCKAACKHKLFLLIS